MYGCESWTIKKAECQRVDAFELWYWRKLLRVPWTARRSNQSILKEISPAYSLKGLMLKLKLQYFGHLMWRNDLLEKTLAGSQHEELRPWQRSWGRRLRHRQRQIEPQETPCSQASTPKTRVYLLYCFMLSPTRRTLWGAVPHRLSRRRSKLAASVNKNSWVWQGCLWSNLSAGRLACVTGLSTLLPLSNDCLLPLNHKQHREFGVFWKS